METKEMEQKALTLESKVMALKITCNDELKQAGDILYQIKDFIKTFEAKKKELVKPFKEAIHKLESEFDPKIDKAKELKAILEQNMTGFQMQEMKRKEEEERQRRIAEALRLEKIKDELEEKAAKENNNAVLNEALKIEERQNRVLQDPIKVSQTVKSGVATTGLRMVWDYRIINEADIPRDYCSADSGKLRRAVNSGIREIKGVEIFEKPTVTSRL